jgi:hypothetical protein
MLSSIGPPTRITRGTFEFKCDTCTETSYSLANSAPYNWLLEELENFDGMLLHAFALTKQCWDHAPQKMLVTQALGFVVLSSLQPCVATIADAH